MSKELTEKWRSGELPREFYYIRDRRKEVYVSCLIDYKTEKDWVKEVLTPVPSYEEYKKLQELLSEKSGITCSMYEGLVNCRTAELLYKNKELVKIVKKLEKSLSQQKELFSQEQDRIKMLLERVADADKMIKHFAEKNGRMSAIEYLNKWGVK